MRKKLNVLFFDIETSDLDADIGHTFCIGYAFNDGPVEIIRGRKSSDDRDILEKFTRVWEKADVVVAHYGKGFDECFLQTRRLIHGMKPLPTASFVDTWWIARKKLKFKSNRLDRLAEMLDCPVKKTVLSIKIWAKARFGDKKSLDYIVHHCVNDVKILRFVAKKLAPYWENHPAVTIAERGRCGCGGLLYANGIRPTAKSIYQRLVCVECGKSRKGGVAK